MKIPMLGSAVWTATVLFASTALAQVSPNGYVTNSNFAVGGSTTFVRDGSTSNAYAWTEATLWNPDSTYTVLGNDYSGLPFSQSITPSHGTGTYWIQYRLVDEFYNYEDQWISFTVYQPNRAPTLDNWYFVNHYYLEGTSYHLISSAFDEDGDMNYHSISVSYQYGSSVNYYNPGYSSYLSTDIYVPVGQYAIVYFIVQDSYGHYISDSILING